MWDLVDRHIVVTGAGGGIGRALVALFHEAGARISAVDRDAEAIAGLPVADRAVFELRDGPAVRDGIARLIERQGAPAVIISNAGFTRAETFADLTDDTFVSELDINLTGAYRVIDSCLPAMVAAGGGSIVAVSSVNALAHFGNPAYSAAKAGLLAYIRGVASEWGRHGIRANAVCPGSVMTPAWDHRFARDPSLSTRVLEHYPLGRLVSPEEVARSVAFLASSLSSGITGVALPVDAGLTAGNLGFVRGVLGG